MLRTAIFALSWLCMAAFPKTRVILLGTGTPIPDVERSGPAVAIVVNDTPYLVDCGTGVVRRAVAAGLEPSQLRTAFITHLHSDHTIGLPDLILTTWVQGRFEPMEVYGPKGTKDMTQHIVAAWREDIEMRTKGLEYLTPTAVNPHEISAGLIYQDRNVKVKAFPVKHGAWAQAFGYRFETPDRTIVISGDTTPTSEIIDNCSGCDVLVHEVYNPAVLATAPAHFRNYHSSFHTSAQELGEIARKAKPRLLVLYHQLFFGLTEENLLEQVRQGYSGKVVSGRDLDVY